MLVERKARLHVTSGVLKRLEFIELITDKKCQKCPNIALFWKIAGCQWVKFPSSHLYKDPL